jgi:hypothetical protein
MDLGYVIPTFRRYPFVGWIWVGVRTPKWLLFWLAGWLWQGIPMPVL